MIEKGTPERGSLFVFSDILTTPSDESIFLVITRLPPVNCYPQRLNQVFMNLPVNAGQAIESKGRSDIQTRGNQDHVTIIISDTGGGIPREYVNKVFDPFFTTKAVGKGTGLGLNVVYNVIKSHQETGTVESTVGQGTAFTIRLPVQPVLDGSAGYPDNSILGQLNSNCSILASS